jgi:hypothetical protein
VPNGTGAAEVAKAFCESIQQQDWNRAYAALDAPCRKGCTAEKFNRLAADYRKNMGLELREVFVRSCEEHGDQALAHVVFTGSKPDGQKFYKEVIALKHGETGWAVVLPPRFGRR